MSEELPVLFDFRPYVGETADYRQLIREFAAGPAFRSATVDELVLADDFHRRPLRPEDLEFLQFGRPVESATVSRLPALASQRMLSSLHELASAVPPAGHDPGRLTAFAEFANERNRLYAARLLPFLEAYAFNFLGNGLAPGEGTRAQGDRLGALYTDESVFWERLFEQLAANGYLEQGLRFILIQRWCLAPSRSKVLAEALARGHFAGWPVGSAPSLGLRVLTDDLFLRLARASGVEQRQHSYWQFYLGTSLARCNLLYSLARRPELAFALYGALYAAQAEQLAFETALAARCAHLVATSDAMTHEPQRHLVRLLDHFESALQFASRQCGTAAALQMSQGLGVVTGLAERSRWDLGEQLSWLSSIERYREHAHTLSRRIEAECPDIDRDTFVEPRDMCSTTHVHSDHRLVTIEIGVMHFWGNLGMRLQLSQGDRVLIPEGRLHGSTVLSAECTYHQPIIPDDWVRALAATGPEASVRVLQSARASG